MHKSNMRRFVTMTNKQLTDELWRARNDAREAEGRLNFEYLLEEGGYHEEISRYHSQEDASHEATLALVAELRRRGVEPPAGAVFWALDDRKVAEVQAVLQELADEEAAIAIVAVA